MYMLRCTYIEGIEMERRENMEISSAEFRANCFKLLDQVVTTREELIITKRGKPVVKVTSVDGPNTEDPLLGALIGAGSTVGDLTEPLVDRNEWETD